MKRFMTLLYGLICYMVFLGALGWGLVLLSTFLINHFELFGLQQVYLHWRQRQPMPARFPLPWLYRLVRHPRMLGFAQRCRAPRTSARALRRRARRAARSPARHDARRATRSSPCTATNPATTARRPRGSRKRVGASRKSTPPASRPAPWSQARNPSLLTNHERRARRSSSALPCLGCAAKMKDGEHDYFVVSRHEEDAVWKAADEGSPVARFDLGKLPRSRGDPVQRSIDLSVESSPQACACGLVVDDRLDELRAGLEPKLEPPHFRGLRTRS